MFVYNRSQTGMRNAEIAELPVMPCAPVSSHGQSPCHVLGRTVSPEALFSPSLGGRSTQLLRPPLKLY